MKRYEVCLCEPFILPGILPTLGTPTLKAVLNTIGVKSKIFYPSLHLFVENKYYENEMVLKCISDIPLQFSEFLYNTKNVERGIMFLENEMGIENGEEILNVLKNANEILKRVVFDIHNSQAKILTYSLTFGDYNFAFELFRRLKSINENLIIIVGGSMCTPQLAKEIITLCPEIDYILCDEDVDSYKKLVLNLLQDNTYDNPYITSREKDALKMNKIKELDHLPCPDFSDYVNEIENLRLKKEAMIIPYEISRGCWWGEKKSCAMCGYFGYQKCFLIKSPKKVISDLKMLKELYQINYIRFTDLVEPRREYLEKVDDITELGMNFFWELRPNINEEDVARLRKMGLFYSQIGFESLSSDELEYIHKGTTAINNIYLLILLMSYKIRIDWNYLYGFSDDKREWYESVLDIIPYLYHLFPPALRQVWINRESRIFNNSEKNELNPVGSKVFHEGFSDDIEVFYQTKINSKLKDVYRKLSDKIDTWKKCFSRGYQLCFVYDNFDVVHIMRKYEKEEHFFFRGVEAEIYLYIVQPSSIEKIQKIMGMEQNEIKKILESFVKKRIAIYMDDKYLALATRSTQYRWKKYNLLKELFERKSG